MAMSPTAPACDVFAAIADPTRRSIIALLAQAERSVGELTDAVAISMSAVSQHLTVLRLAGLVRMRQVGRSHRYRLQPEALAEVSSWISKHTTYWDARLQALRAEVEDEQP